MKKQVNILGIRGLPAAHGGFETFAHHFALWLKDKGWSVLVYCQHDAVHPNAPPDGFEDEWQGVKRVHFRIAGSGPLSTIKFDYRSVRDVLKRPGVDLVLGYNTAIFSVLQRLQGRKIIMNMDGIEWKRDKWNALAKTWFWFNEVIGAHLSHFPIADHPEIAKHLQRHRTSNITVIPYGSASITQADEAAITSLGLKADRYFISIARIEPENSILEVVRTFSARPRGIKLVVLGSFKSGNSYHQKVIAAASDEVVFPGAIFDARIVSALRFYARAYIHGHQVGGTNPSLVEALGAGNAIIAHDNKFNRWVAGAAQAYFSDDVSLERCIQSMSLGSEVIESMRAESRKRHNDFTLDIIHREYEKIILRAIS